MIQPGGGYNRTFIPALRRLPQGAGVDEGASVEEVSLVYTSTRVDEGAGVEDITFSVLYTGLSTPAPVQMSRCRRHHILIVFYTGFFNTGAGVVVYLGVGSGQAR